eukprot:scaffold451_cov121-Cylindrotheca_fusiformis.AAC.2
MALIASHLQLESRKRFYHQLRLNLRNPLHTTILSWDKEAQELRRKHGPSVCLDSFRNQECLRRNFKDVPTEVLHHIIISHTVDHLSRNRTSKSRYTPNLESLVDGSCSMSVESSAIKWQ